MEGFDEATLLNLLEMYEAAIRDLENTGDPMVAGVLRRLERHRAEVVSALATQHFGADE